MGVVAFAGSAVAADAWTELAWNVQLCLVGLTIAVAPRWVHDGRFDAWLDRSPLVRGVLGFVVPAVPVSAALDRFVRWQLAVAVAIPVGVVAAVLFVRLGREGEAAASAEGEAG